MQAYHSLKLPDGRLLSLQTPKVMGILNVTPDSFYDGGRYDSRQAAVDRAGKMLEEGADLLDIGGYSTRPGADDIPQEEEQQRVLQALEPILEAFPNAIISIDTFRASVAKAAVQQGAHAINDISGGSLDEKMFATVGELGVPYFLMHTRGTPQTMKTLTQYDNLLNELLDYFQERLLQLRNPGVKDVIIDPGFGFAKTLDQNYELLAQLEHLQMLGCPLLVGVSRKSMVYKKLGTSAQEALNGTTALHILSLQQGANILRVHDPKEAEEAITLFQSFQDAKKATLQRVAFLS